VRRSSQVAFCGELHRHDLAKKPMRVIRSRLDSARGRNADFVGVGSVQPIIGRGAVSLGRVLAGIRSLVISLVLLCMSRLNNLVSELGSVLPRLLFFLWRIFWLRVYKKRARQHRDCLAP